LGAVRFGTVRQVRHGPARYDAVGSGSGVVGYGKAGVARHGSVRCGTEWLGKAGRVRLGFVRCEMVR
jgi:hypothetical protein